MATEATQGPDVGGGRDVVVPCGPHDEPCGRALVTNDDGVGSEGLFALARAVRAAGLEPVVVAPEDNMSGAGTGIGYLDVHEGVGFQHHDRDGITAVALSGPPGLAVLSVALGAFGGLPDLVVSGINAGVNTGHSVIHSGTVGAALTARTFGRSGLAISLAPSGPQEPWRWDTAEVVAAVMCRWLHELDRDDLVLNVNVPAVDVADLRGIRWATLESFGHIRVASTDPDGARVEFGISREDTSPTPDSDHSLLQDGWATVTALLTVEEDAVVDAPLPPL